MHGLGEGSPGPGQDGVRPRVAVAGAGGDGRSKAGQQAGTLRTGLEQPRQLRWRSELSNERVQQLRGAVRTAVVGAQRRRQALTPDPGTAAVVAEEVSPAVGSAPASLRGKSQGDGTGSGCDHRPRLGADRRGVGG
jgi:hypothetical protein